MHPVAKTLIAIGAVLVVAGLLWQFVGRWLPLGRLPGDIVIRKEGFSFYFPIVTSLLLSVVLTLLAWLWNWLGRQ
ncbi:DUF2905 domain-containing protein [Kyrpidia spormannii]|uniref:DUF2905 domain-containing protein n=2 Tax=Kyrpidia spormannii TaxID=2055160 RepID=A0A2K8N8I6_9BACL|nr:MULTISPECIES: DUF2905 domain-containing protein [Kyrpidia]ATY85425.1 DUF2905 domain-containing protein [Kyrpidia spormannii]MCL6575415.1 DUF2905 domain-containing protein [Kyrpidia sp.]CAB3393507.1 conserved protein of unknown function [Kyrpidia spormannii]CAB3394429.1 conserved protein of unknown function [Kyrpidia spormannii]